MRELGIRGIFGRGCMDTGIQYGVHPGITQQKDDIEKGVRDIFERYHNCDNGRIKIWVAPAAMWSNTRGDASDALEGDQRVQIRHYHTYL